MEQILTAILLHIYLVLSQLNLLLLLLYHSTLLRYQSPFTHARHNDPFFRFLALLGILKLKVSHLDDGFSGCFLLLTDSFDFVHVGLEAGEVLVHVSNDECVGRLDPSFNLQEHGEHGDLFELTLLFKLFHNVPGRFTDHVVGLRRDCLSGIVDRFGFQVLEFADSFLILDLHFSLAILKVLKFCFGLTMHISEIALFLLDLLFILLALLNQAQVLFL